MTLSLLLKLFFLACATLATIGVAWGWWDRRKAAKQADELRIHVYQNYGLRQVWPSRERRRERR